jgi:hypothetical protein
MCSHRGDNHLLPRKKHANTRAHHDRRGKPSHRSQVKRDDEPTHHLADQYFNDSTGVGDKGETDARGPWTEVGEWEIVAGGTYFHHESTVA